MPPTTEIAAPTPHARLRSAAAWTVGLLLIVAGCSSDKENASSTGSAAPKPPTPPLQATRAFSLPGPSPQTELFIKPGHWTSAWLEAIAEDDFRGGLETQLVDGTGTPLAYPPLKFFVKHDRPVVLPKKQLRGFEQPIFTPNDYDVDGPGVMDHRESLLRDAGGRFRLSGQMGLSASDELRIRTTVLRDHQALFVVLAAKPHQYAFLNSSDALNTTHSPSVLPEQDVHYRTVFAATPSRALLPSSVPGWTTTAYLLWDGFDPGLMSEEQRRALVDWIYWGGVLIVAGPNTIDLPLGEPLQSLSPATTDGSLALDAAALAPLTTLARRGESLAVAKSWGGARLQVRPQSTILLGTAAVPLIVERRVGRGRIVMTAFHPTQGEFLTWPSFGGFINAYLLRRPARQWRSHPHDSKFISVVWNDRPSLYTDAELRNGVEDPWFDPARVSKVRFAAKDDVRTDRRRMLDVQPPIGPGPAAWRDEAVVAATVRDVLRDASGIFVPSASRVLLLLTMYVVLAVPVNWLVFRTLKRTEWAWLVTPLLAVVFTVVVVRAANLDLGFVRSVSETAILEIQPGYDRGNLVRCTAIYNSLGTTYSLSSDDPSFVALPAARTLDGKQPAMDQTVTVDCRDDDGEGARSALTGFVVDSGSVGYVRAEQMTPLGGVLRATRATPGSIRIENGTQWELRDVRIVGQIGARGGAIDALSPGAVVEVAINSNSPAGDFAARQAEINVDPLWEQMQKLSPDEQLRLVAWSPTPAPGMQISPAPSQRRSKTVVVAHLEYVPDPAPQMDANTRREVELRVLQNP